MKFKESGIQKKVQDKGEGKYFQLSRDTVKEMKGKKVYFTAPFIYDKDGKVIVKYTDEKGADVRSYEDKNITITRVGDPVLGA